MAVYLGFTVAINVLIILFVIGVANFLKKKRENGNNSQSTYSTSFKEKKPDEVYGDVEDVWAKFDEKYKS